jgi:hypothetical protein
VLATRFGGKAVELLRRGVFGKMVANHPPDIVPVPLARCRGTHAHVPLDYDLLTNRARDRHLIRGLRHERFKARRVQARTSDAGPTQVS